MHEELQNFYLNHLKKCMKICEIFKLLYLSHFLDFLSNSNVYKILHPSSF